MAEYRRITMFLNDLAAQCATQYRTKSDRQGQVRFELNNRISRGLCGRIVCTSQNNPFEFEQWLVRYFFRWLAQPQISVPVFLAEWQFYSRIVPAFNCLGPVHRMLPLSCWRVNQKMAGVMLHLPNQFSEVQLSGHLDYPHLSMMATTIGRFHAYSFQLPAEDIVILSEGLRPYQPHLCYCELVMPTLLRCIDGLLTDGYLVRCKNVGGFWQLLDMVDKLSQKLCTLAEEGCSQYVVCSHQNYTREQVTFQYDHGMPKDLRIVEWRSVGWTSLGVDLATLLYVECDGTVREMHKFDLLTNYRNALWGTFVPSPNLPNWSDMMVEIQKCIPVALCILGLKNWHPSGLWNDRFIMQVFEDLIETYMVWS